MAQEGDGGISSAHELERILQECGPFASRAEARKKVVTHQMSIGKRVIEAVSTSATLAKPDRKVSPVTHTRGVAGVGGDHLVVVCSDTTCLDFEVHFLRRGRMKEKMFELDSGKSKFQHRDSCTSVFKETATTKKDTTTQISAESSLTKKDAVLLLKAKGGERASSESVSAGIETVRLKKMEEELGLIDSLTSLAAKYVARNPGGFFVITVADDLSGNFICHAFRQGSRLVVDFHDVCGSLSKLNEREAELLFPKGCSFHSAVQIFNNSDAVLDISSTASLDASTLTFGGVRLCLNSLVGGEHRVTLAHGFFPCENAANWGHFRGVAAAALPKSRAGNRELVTFSERDKGISRTTPQPVGASPHLLEVLLKGEGLKRKGREKLRDSFTKIFWELRRAPTRGEYEACQERLRALMGDRSGPILAYLDSIDPIHTRTFEAHRQQVAMHQIETSPCVGTTAEICDSLSPTTMFLRASVEHSLQIDRFLKSVEFVSQRHVTFLPKIYDIFAEVATAAMHLHPNVERRAGGEFCVRDGEEGVLLSRDTRFCPSAQGSCVEQNQLGLLCKHGLALAIADDYGAHASAKDFLEMTYPKCYQIEALKAGLGAASETPILRSQLTRNFDDTMKPPRPRKPQNKIFEDVIDLVLFDERERKLLITEEQISNKRKNLEDDGEGVDLLPRISYSSLYEKSHPDLVASRTLPLSIFPEYPAAADPVDAAVNGMDIRAVWDGEEGVGPIPKKGRVGPSKVTCGYCHEIGHNARGCPVKKSGVAAVEREETRDAE